MRCAVTSTIWMTRPDFYTCDCGVIGPTVETRIVEEKGSSEGRHRGVYDVKMTERSYRS